MESLEGFHFGFHMEYQITNVQKITFKNTIFGFVTPRRVTTKAFVYCILDFNVYTGFPANQVNARFK